MLKNQIQFQKGYSLTELFHDYGTEEQCTKALFDWRWPTGFNCPACCSSSYCTLKNTLFDSTKLPLTTWFLAIYLITQAKTGISALALKREIGVGLVANGW